MLHGYMIHLIQRVTTSKLEKPNRELWLAQGMRCSSYKTTVRSGVKLVTQFTNSISNAFARYCPPHSDHFRDQTRRPFRDRTCNTGRPTNRSCILPCGSLHTSHSAVAPATLTQLANHLRVGPDCFLRCRYTKVLSTPPSMLRNLRIPQRAIRNSDQNSGLGVRDHPHRKCKQNICVYRE